MIRCIVAPNSAHGEDFSSLLSFRSIPSQDCNAVSVCFQLSPTYHVHRNSVFPASIISHKGALSCHRAQVSSCWVLDFSFPSLSALRSMACWSDGTQLIMSRPPASIKLHHMPGALSWADFTFVLIKTRQLDICSPHRAEIVLLLDTTCSWVAIWSFSGVVLETISLPPNTLFSSWAESVVSWPPPYSILLLKSSEPGVGGRRTLFFFKSPIQDHHTYRNVCQQWWGHLLKHRALSHSFPPDERGLTPVQCAVSCQNSHANAKWGECFTVTKTIRCSRVSSSQIYRTFREFVLLVFVPFSLLSHSDFGAASRAVRVSGACCP